jgi:hypothetical protein
MKILAASKNDIFRCDWAFLLSLKIEIIFLKKLFLEAILDGAASTLNITHRNPQTPWDATKHHQQQPHITNKDYGSTSFVFLNNAEARYTYNQKNQTSINEHPEQCSNKNKFNIHTLNIHSQLSLKNITKLL